MMILILKFLEIIFSSLCYFNNLDFRAQSAGAEEYTDCVSVEG